ncbi:hypothetical protein EVAR_22076_1 [Eumeta japonica]|uniref:Uncharacterized protein n=1 Tax=Eumeta variegata TaxID=151549 RepID=A0A4C1UUH7_EUMVA|nr:hypothetical protein EVAR_22076_1 [Eumeta japonica]
MLLSLSRTSIPGPQTNRHDVRNNANGPDGQIAHHTRAQASPPMSSHRTMLTLHTIFEPVLEPHRQAPDPLSLRRLSRARPAPAVMAKASRPRVGVLNVCQYARAPARPRRGRVHSVANGAVFAYGVLDDNWLYLACNKK